MNIGVTAHGSKTSKLKLTYKSVWFWIAIAVVYQLTMAQTHGWAIRFITNGLYTEFFPLLLIILLVLSIANGIHSIKFLSILDVINDFKKYYLIYIIILIIILDISAGITQTQFTHYQPTWGSWILLTLSPIFTPFLLILFNLTIFRQFSIWVRFQLILHTFSIVYPIAQIIMSITMMYIYFNKVELFGVPAAVFSLLLGIGHVVMVLISALYLLYIFTKSTFSRLSESSDTETPSEEADGETTETESSGQQSDQRTTPSQTATSTPERENRTVTRELVDEVEALEWLTVVDDDGPLEIYRGEHGEGRDVVRVLTPSDHVDLEAEPFDQAVRGWVNGNSHPNVVTIQDRGVEPRPWVATESAADWATLAERPDELNLEQTMSVLTDAAEGLRTVALYNAHHHNLAPQHIWVRGQDGDAVGKVDDWGLDRALRETAGETVITPYTAPEQLSDAYGQSQEATDIYGLGAVAYHVLTGNEPVVAERDAILAGDITPPSEIAAVPAPLDEVLLGALATDPADRYDSMADFAVALDTVL